MTMQRKEFGRRSVRAPHQAVQTRVQAGSSYAGGAAYAGAGGGFPSPSSDDTFSAATMLLAPLSMLFSFSGRLGRMEFWTIGFARWFVEIILLFIFISSAFADLQHLASPGSHLTEGEVNIEILKALYGSTTGIVCGFLLLLTSLSHWSLQVRRNHDRDVSGFWLLLIFVPIVGAFYGLYIFVANGFFPGTPGPNQYDTGRSQARVFD